MARTRPATTGYERLAQADGFSDGSDDESTGHGAMASSFASLQPPRGSHGMAVPSSMPSGSGAIHLPYSSSMGGGRRRRASSGVDLKAINARLENWADEIAAKFKNKRGKRRGGTHGSDDEDEDEQLEIHYSVFQAPEGVRPVTAEGLAQTAQTAGHMTRGEFEVIVESVRTAIREGMHPRMISQGSSGSYFARSPEGKVVGVFKPKDEEPYAAGNPKWNKWIHRNLFPCCFGRACLIPNLSYVSEAAAYVLDAQLRTHMVPYTDVVYLASRSFHYPFWDRYSHSRHRKPLPAKPGSFQVFLQGFKDANIFLREHPWPDQYLSGIRTDTGRRRRRQRRWTESCRPSLKQNGSGDRSSPSSGDSSGRRRGEYNDVYDEFEDDYDEDDEDSETEADAGPGSNGNGASGQDRVNGGAEQGNGTGVHGGEGGARPKPHAKPRPRRFAWTELLKESFREELEKLVILDYIMRNTDRGLDNWMIKVDWTTQEVAIASEPMHLNMDGPEERADDDDEDGPAHQSQQQGPRPVDLSQRPVQETRARVPSPFASYRTEQPMQASSPAPDDVRNGSENGSSSLNGGSGGSGSSSRRRGAVDQPTLTIGAIDNSLSWPWKHPDAWRSFPFGWLFLPVDLIGRPFSQKTRDHFLPLLTSTAWWSQTQRALRRVFQMDPDFQERMFARQMAVMKGQAWNVVETLKTADHGPLELTRRAKVCVWDDLVEIPIAVPMRAASLEMRRRAEAELERAMDEEMDIGALGNSVSSLPAGAKKQKKAKSQNQPKHQRQHSEDLLEGGSSERSSSSPPPQASPVPRLSRPGELVKETVAEESEGDGGGLRTSGSAVSVPAKGHARTPSRTNALNMYAPQHQRRYSFTTAASRRNSNSIAHTLYGGGSSSSGEAAGPSSGTGLYTGESRAGGGYGQQPYMRSAASMDGYHMYEEDLEGDLGYAAAEGMENNRRRVIVERLEPVKSKNPVFTWC